MKKVSFVFIMLLLIHPSVNAQVNLVPNPSFETIISCDSLGAGSVCNNQVPPWNCQGGSPDVFNTCSTDPSTNVPINYVGYQIPHSLNGYVGLFNYATVGLNYRETIKVRLDSTLMQNKKYCISFYVNLANNSAYAANNMGVYISDSVINLNTSLFTISPQILYSNIISDTANWTLVSGQYFAHGGEQYIFIGNFFPDSSTIIVIANHNTLLPYPLAYYYVDDVSIVDCTGLGVEEINNPYHMSLSPNPNNGEMKIEYKLANTNDKGTISIYDITGTKINEYPLNPNNESLVINEAQLSNGIYFCKYLLNEKLIRTDKIVIIR